MGAESAVAVGALLVAAAQPPPIDDVVAPERVDSPAIKQLRDAVTASSQAPYHDAALTALIDSLGDGAAAALWTIFTTGTDFRSSHYLDHMRGYGWSAARTANLHPTTATHPRSAHKPRLW